MGAGAELLLGVALGLTLAPPPGPMNAWIAAAAVRSYRAGVATGLGAVGADALLGALVWSVGRVVDLTAVLRFVDVLGAAVLGFFAYRLLRAANGSVRSESDYRSFAQALGIGLSNPYQILWWLTAGVGFASVGGAWLLAGLFGALLAWVFAFPFVLRLGGRRHPKIEPVVRYVSGAALVGFAAYFVALAIVG